MSPVWLDPQPVNVPSDLRDYIGGHPLVAEMLVRRGIGSVEAARSFLDPHAYTPTPPWELPDLDRAVSRVIEAIQRAERICVWGDFDVDGQTATTVLVSTLRELHADVIYHIPVRATESHGIRLPQLVGVLEEGVRLLITCDTGIDAHEAVDHAQAQGVDVIITDHHELPLELPHAYAVVNPHRLPEDHPLASLPGVGVAYKLAEGLYQQVGREEAAGALLDLVALGIVADVAVQRGETRYLLQRGLEQLRRTQRLGLREMMAQAKVAPPQLNETHIGFSLAPRLNALGRLDDAAEIVEFLTTSDLSRARILASGLEALNERRKLLTDQVLAAAEAQIEKEPMLLESSVLVLDSPTWPVGVIGIVANRLAERHQRPAILIATPSGELGHGSARSVEGVHITQALATLADLLRSYGGHSRAAGLSIDSARIAEFRLRLSRAVSLQLAEAEAQPGLAIDGYVAWQDLSLALADDIGRLAPFGEGNPRLVLASRDLTVKAQRTVGRDGRHLRLTLEGPDGSLQDVLWWQWDNAPVPQGRFDLAFTMSVSDYRGAAQLQLEWQAAREARAPALAVPEITELELVDYRRVPEPHLLLAPYLGQEDAVVWAEGPAARDVAGAERQARLRHARTLVIWTQPAGLKELRAAMAAAAPQQVVVFAIAPGLERAEQFLPYLTGLVKYALKTKGGRVEVRALAEATGHRDSTIRHALAWLVARGEIGVLKADDDTLFLSKGIDPAPDLVRKYTALLQDALEETAAYRQAFVKADLERLFREIAERRGSTA